ncbi:MAG: hypothetical protein COA79_16410 [Planctomycetota bacterium]|nr:MAG: hypothetical protein COA79_16410 [Planctomycetota bacterium]
MNIGIIIGRIGDVDGVALETEKWIHVLKNMGHKIFLLSGRFKEHVIPEEQETLFRPLSFFSPECEWEQNRAFFYPNEDPGELMAHLEETSDRIALKIFKWILKNQIQVLLSENASALPCHLSMGLGIKKAVENTGIKIVTHDHDFHWERGDRYSSPHEEITKLINETFPLQLPDVRHAVINTYNQNLFKDKFGINPTLVPNVMDFNKPYAEKDDYNKTMLAELGIKDDEIALSQITRIVKRKGIETALELIHRLDDKKVKLVITGSAADDERKGYYKELLDYTREKGLEDRVIFAYKKILSQRDTAYNGSRIYSLEDAYAHTTACTYFSTYEGFGNAFVECILAKKPIFVNNYIPVYWPDIGSKGFKTVQIDDSNLTDQAVTDIDKIIHDEKAQKEIADFNFELGKKHFSYEVLSDLLEELFTF